MARSPRTPRPRRGVSLFDKARVIVPTNGFSIIINSPFNGEYLATTSPNLNITPNRTTVGTVDVQVEWRKTPPMLTGVLSSAFYTQSISDLPQGVPVNIPPPAIMAKGTWWYRVRGGDNVANIWGAWTDLNRTLNLTMSLGSISSYLDVNIGAGNSPVPSTFAYVDLNIGAAAIQPDDFTMYSEINVGAYFPQTTSFLNYSEINIGVPLVMSNNIYQYSDLNVDTTSPTPHIWWIRPDFGREGYVFNIYGHGFGLFQGQYGGVVRLGDYVCPVLRWERIPAVAPPDTIVKGDDPESDIIKPEHGWIVVVVPTNAVTDYVQITLEGA